MDLARRMAAIVLGQHHTLLAGPAGSGKSTLSKALHNLLPDLRGQALTELIRWNRFFSRDEVTARPLAQPHHTASAFAVLGGGKPIVPGEMSKAHLGMLILDEFLEFNSAVREGLREPLESGVIHLARQGQGECIPADFVLVATTNLCPCGDFIPNDPRVRCPRSLRQCRSYLDRLSGPVADRFDVLIFSNDWQRTGVVTEKEIFAMVETGRENQLKMNPRSQANGRLFENELHSHLEKPNLKDFLPASGKSRRRNQSVLRVARTLADLDGSEAIKLCHLNEAIDLAWRPFQTMRKAHI